MEPQPSRTRVLSDDELRAIWQAAETMGTFGTIVRLLILTGQRKMEIGSLRWSWIAKDAITLPGDVTKNGREHTFPLCPLATSHLPMRGSGFLFRATDSEDIYNGYTYHLRQLQKTSETSGWTLHDLRRTVATNLASLGTPIHVTEKILNHVSGSISGVAAIYNRHAYFDEMREALTMWEQRVQAVCKHAAAGGKKG